MRELDDHETEGWIYGRDLPVLGKRIEQPVHYAWDVYAGRTSKVVFNGLR